MKDKKSNKLSLNALILMIFTSVYGFANMPRAFFRMGYSAIPWYILGALFFFLPFAFMVTELGSAYRNERGGIYTWMEKSVSPTFAFIGTFMWFTSFVIWMVSVSSGLFGPITSIIYGYPNFEIIGSRNMSFFAVLWIILVTFLVSQGLTQIKKITTIGGYACLTLNFVLLIGSLVVLFGNGFSLETPLTIESFFKSAQPGFQHNIVSYVGFMVYAIFAYGGVEAVGGLADETENAEKNFPKGVLVASIVIAVGYSLGIFLIGVFTNYTNDITNNTTIPGGVHLGTMLYATMNNLGVSLGNTFGLSSEASIQIGYFLARYTAVSLLLSLTGAFFILTFSPLKQLIEGTPKGVWPAFITKTNKKGMLQNALWIQCAIVVFIILLNGLGGNAASVFFEILTNMTNVSMTLPYLFIVYAYYKFKSNNSIEKPFEILKTKSSANFCVLIVMLVVGFANFFTIIEPLTVSKITSKEILSTVSMIAGPVIFGAIAIILMKIYQSKKIKDV